MVENVAPTQTWEALKSDASARLVDVRTDAEWNFVGVPDLSPAGKQTVLIPWQVYPTMQRNGGFEDDLKRAGLTPENTLYFICRSGAVLVVLDISAAYPKALSFETFDEVTADKTAGTTN